MILTDREKLFEQSYLPHVVTHRVFGNRAFFANIPDIHHGLNNRPLVQEAVKFFLSIPDLYIGIGGDSGNNSSKASKGNQAEEYACGDKQMELLAEDLRPLAEAGRILYIIEGNHGSGRTKDTHNHSPEKYLATLLYGKDFEKVYKNEAAILYFNVNKNCYVHFATHEGRKKEDFFAWVQADVTWREHFHELKKIPKLVMEHNKFAKKPIIKETFEIRGGNWQILPAYAKRKGYRPTKPGCYVVEMSGEQNNWKMFAYTDEELYHMVQSGFLDLAEYIG